MRKRNSSAGRPPAGPCARLRPTGSIAPRRSRTRLRFVVDTSYPSAASYTSLSSARVNVSGARAKAMLEYESLPWSLSRPASTIAPWSNAVVGSASTLYQVVSRGMWGSMPCGTSPRYAVASSQRWGWRPGSLQVPSCSRWETSRTSTFVARCLRMDCSSVSAGPSVPPGSDQVRRKGSRARSHRSTESVRSRTWKTTARATCAGWSDGVVDSGTRLSTVRRKLP